MNCKVSSIPLMLGLDSGDSEAGHHYQTFVTFLRQYLSSLLCCCSTRRPALRVCQHQVGCSWSLAQMGCVKTKRMLGLRGFPAEQCTVVR